MENIRSMYAQVFDSSNPNWDKDREFNLTYLKAQQNYFNDLLKHRGYVFLRDVQECLGLKVTRLSLFVGWFYDLENAFGDNYIDFGIQVDKDGESIWLDFNVDGDITERLEDGYEKEDIDFMRECFTRKTKES